MDDDPVAPWFERYFKDMLHQHERWCDDRFKANDRAIETALRASQRADEKAERAQNMRQAIVLSLVNSLLSAIALYFSLRR